MGPLPKTRVDVNVCGPYHTHVQDTYDTYVDYMVQKETAQALTRALMRPTWTPGASPIPYRVASQWSCTVFRLSSRYRIHSEGMLDQLVYADCCALGAAISARVCSAYASISSGSQQSSAGC